MNLFRIAAGAALVFLLGAQANKAAATLVHYAFDFGPTSVSIPIIPLTTVGGTITGLFTYDDAAPSAPGVFDVTALQISYVGGANFGTYDSFQSTAGTFNLSTTSRPTFSTLSHSLEGELNMQASGSTGSASIVMDFTNGQVVLDSEGSGIVFATYSGPVNYTLLDTTQPVVPEPATLSLCALGLGALVRRRKFMRRG